MDINALTSTGTSTATNQALKGLTDNFDNFLKLLTKQLQHQDPLSPLDTNEFTGQLVQFTGVEQAIATNKKLDSLIGLQTASQASTAISYLGTTVDAETNRVALADGEGEFVYALSEAAKRTAVIILDAQGKPVRVANGETKAGKHTFEWDGKDNDGGRLPDGVYSVEVTAFDADGKAISSAVGTSGRVTGVQIVGGEILLSLGELQIPFSQVYSVRAGDDDDGGLI
jgi:flagellar basal-body rod modification protein FlgD